ncbi:MAG: ATP phosphoribosyltransferase [Candidatus Altiarchaeales archaeon]|nr:ATP phosphoribosyltransferase [Candidatus Altiarchaeales archaeon]
MDTMNKLRLGLPKGSLQESTFRMFLKAGFHINVSSRSYHPSIDDSEVEPVLLRAQEIPRYVESGILDAGITGFDWVVENGVESKVVEVAELLYAKQGLGKVRWVLAVPEESRIKDVKDLQGKSIATEVVNVTKNYLKKHGVKADVEFSWGATEVKAGELVDAIVEITETGSSLKANKLRIVDTILESTTKLIANKRAWQDKWKKHKLEEICLLLKGALAAEEKVGLKMNVKRSNLSRILEMLPALKEPTISNLTNPNWVALEIVIDEKVVRELVPKLKKAGAQGIIEYPLNKIIL